MSARSLGTQTALVVALVGVAFAIVGCDAPPTVGHRSGADTPRVFDEPVAATPESSAPPAGPDVPSGRPGADVPPTTAPNEAPRDEPAAVAAPNGPVAERASPYPFETIVSSQRFGVGIVAGRETKGPADALVTAIAWIDYGCRECSEPLRTFGGVLQTHTDVRGALRFVPRTTHAGPASRAVLAAGLQGKLWEAHEAVVALGEEIDPKAVLAAIAKTGVDSRRLVADMDSERIQAVLDEDVRVVELVRGNAPPPVFFVNGRFMDRVVGPADFARVIEEEHTKAQEFSKVERVARKRAYEAMRKTWADSEQLGPPAVPK